MDNEARDNYNHAQAVWDCGDVDVTGMGREEGPMVEILRVFMGGDGWKPQMDEVRQGIRAIYEELGFPCTVRNSLYYNEIRWYLRRGSFLCPRLDETGYNFTFKVGGGFTYTDDVSIYGDDGNQYQLLCAFPQAVEMRIESAR